MQIGLAGGQRVNQQAQDNKQNYHSNYTQRSHEFTLPFSRVTSILVSHGGSLETRDQNNTGKHLLSFTPFLEYSS
jgi:hypothetical protein